MAFPFTFSVPSSLSWYKDLALVNIILTKIIYFSYIAVFFIRYYYGLPNTLYTYTDTYKHIYMQGCIQQTMCLVLHQLFKALSRVL